MKVIKEKEPKLVAIGEHVLIEPLKEENGLLIKQSNRGYVLSANKNSELNEGDLIIFDKFQVFEDTIYIIKEEDIVAKYE